MAANIKERTYEYTISFDSVNCEKVDGGYNIHGASIRLARKRQHRHETPTTRPTASIPPAVASVSAWR